jgi:hypothetical protein
MRIFKFLIVFKNQGSHIYRFFSRPSDYLETTRRYPQTQTQKLRAKISIGDLEQIWSDCPKVLSGNRPSEFAHDQRIKTKQILGICPVPDG